MCRRMESARSMSQAVELQRVEHTPSREVAAAEETRGGQMQQCELEIRFGCEVITLRKNRKMLKSEAACAVEWSRKCNNKSAWSHVKPQRK